MFSVDPLVLAAMVALVETLADSIILPPGAPGVFAVSTTVNAEALAVATTLGSGALLIVFSDSVRIVGSIDFDRDRILLGDGSGYGHAPDRINFQTGGIANTGQRHI